MSTSEEGTSRTAGVGSETNERCGGPAEGCVGPAEGCVGPAEGCVGPAESGGGPAESASRAGEGASRTSPGPSQRRTVEDVEQWLVAYLSRLLETPPQGISTRVSFSRYGLDSSASIALASELGDWLGRDLDPTINYAYPTIAALARHLAE